MIRFLWGKQKPRGFIFGGYSERRPPFSWDGFIQILVLGRIAHVHAAPQHPICPAPCLEGALMPRPVDACRHAADDGHPLLCQGKPNLLRRPPAVSRAVPCPDHPDCKSLLGRQASFVINAVRRIVNMLQAPGIILILPNRQLYPIAYAILSLLLQLWLRRLLPGYDDSLLLLCQPGNFF